MNNLYYKFNRILFGNSNDLHLVISEVPAPETQAPEENKEETPTESWNNSQITNVKNSIKTIKKTWFRSEINY